LLHEEDARIQMLPDPGLADFREGRAQHDDLDLGIEGAKGERILEAGHAQVQEDDGRWVPCLDPGGDGPKQ